jgi:hypothetical protein
MFRRRLKLLGKILLGIVLVLVAFLLFERFRGQIALAKYKKTLRAQGEKISPEDFAPTFRPEDNGAPAVFAAIKRLTNGVVLPGSYPPRMKVLESGRAIIGFRESVWVEKDLYRNGEFIQGIFTNRWDDLATDLQRNAATLAEIETALTKPVLNNQLNLVEGIKLQFPHLAPAKSLTYWFGSATQLALHDGRMADAAKYLVSQITLPGLLAEDGVVISELVRIAIGAVARTDTWEALQADGWTDADLAAIQRAWESQEFAASLARNLNGERAFGITATEQMIASNEETYQMIFDEFASLAAAFAGSDGGPEAVDRVPWDNFSSGEAMQEFTRKQIYCRVWRFAWAHQAQVRDMKTMQSLIDLARRLGNEHSYCTVSNSIASLKNQYSRMGIYDRLRFPGSNPAFILSGTVLKAAKLDTDRSLTLCAIGLKRYALRHGKLPETLAVLVPEYFPAVPTDYMDGQPIKYRLNADGSFRLYSVGEDGKDDDGDMTLPEGSKSHDLWRRRDYVWPAPATPEEVEEYRQKANGD